MAVTKVGGLLDGAPMTAQLGWPADVAATEAGLPRGFGEDRLEPGSPSLRASIPPLRFAPQLALRPMTRSTIPQAEARPSAAPSWSIATPAYGREYSVRERAVVDAALMTPRASESTVEALATMMREHPDIAPDRVAALLSRLRYEDGRADDGSGPASTYSAVETLQRGGVCRDQHALSTYLLRAAGYEAQTVGYTAAGNIAHAVTVYRDPETQRWNAIEYGRVHALEAETFGAALATLEPGALKFWTYSHPGADRAQVNSVIQTHAGLELQGVMLGRSAAAPLGQSGFSIGQDRSSASYAVSPTRSVDLFRYSLDADNGPLAGAAIAGMRWATGPGTTLSFGAGHLPAVASRSIGLREASEHELAIAYLGFDRRRELYALDFANDRLSLRGTNVLAAQVGLAYDLGEHAFDPAMSAGMTSVTLEHNATLNFRARSDLDLYLTGTIGVNEATLQYVAQGGALNGLPLTKRVEAGARYRGEHGFVDLGVRLPIGDQPDNLFDRPAVFAHTGMDLGNRWSVFAGGQVSFSAADDPLGTGQNEFGVDSLYAGARLALSDHAAFTMTAQRGDELTLGANLDVNFNWR